MENKESTSVLPPKQARREYDEGFMQKSKDLATIGLQPTQIAERLGLLGKERENFLFDCTNPLHPLHILINIAYNNGQDDIDAALTTIAVSGDVDALELALKAREQNKYLALREKLFGI